MTIRVTGIVSNDMVALEDVETYRVTLSNLNVTSPYITLLPNTRVSIISEDGECAY